LKNEIESVGSNEEVVVFFSCRFIFALLLPTPLHDTETMETYTLPFPAPYSQCHIALFHDVRNAAAIRKRLIAAATMPEDEEGKLARAAVDFGFVEGSLVSDFSGIRGMYMVLVYGAGCDHASVLEMTTPCPRNRPSPTRAQSPIDQSH
jgi:hypothetical protein